MKADESDHRDSRQDSKDDYVDIEAVSYFNDSAPSNGGDLTLNTGLDSMGSDLGLGIGLDMSRTNGLSPHSPAMGSLSSMSSYARLTRNKTQIWASGRPGVKVVVTGISAALPGRSTDVFSKEGIQRIINGQNCILPIPEDVKVEMLEKNVVQLEKNKDGTSQKKPLKDSKDMINLCAALGSFDLTKYGVGASIAATMDRAVQVAVAAGLEALKDSGIVKGGGENLAGWILPESMQDTTGIVYATSFPALDAAIAEVSKFFKSKSIEGSAIPAIVEGLRSRLETVVGKGNLPETSETALKEIEQLAQDLAAVPDKDPCVMEPYEFDRKFLFRVLVLGNGQLAQIVKARGPNMQTNAACAGATQAVALAYDLIQVGRAERVIVIAGDNASSDTLMPWLGNGFRALGAATPCADVKLAALPFDQRRTGMILGSGGIGMVFESEEGARRRNAIAAKLAEDMEDDSFVPRAPFRARLLGTLYSNSAYHGAAMDRKHITQEMERFIRSIEDEQGISRQEICQHGVYFSHETSTNASPNSSCAANEVHALRETFGENLKDLLILNTKGYTGHPMGVSFEDVVACEVLCTGKVPPIANGSVLDPHLGDDLKLSRGGDYPCKYALRFAAGFGSQIALALYGVAGV